MLTVEMVFEKIRGAILSLPLNILKALTQYSRGGFITYKLQATFRRRRAAKPRPANAVPNSNTAGGSGTAAT